MMIGWMLAARLTAEWCWNARTSASTREVMTKSRECHVVVSFYLGSGFRRGPFVAPPRKIPKTEQARFTRTFPPVAKRGGYIYKILLCIPILLQLSSAIIYKDALARKNETGMTLNAVGKNPSVF